MMPKMLFACVIALLVLGVAAQPAPARALEAYSDAQKQEFLDWCTGAKSASESVCSCTLKRVAATVPAATLSSYLASLSSGSSMSLTNLATSSTAMTATTVAQALTTCGN